MVKITGIGGRNPWWRYEKGFIQYDTSLQKAKPIFFKRKQMNFRKRGIYIPSEPR